MSTILVTGSASGLGKAIAETLADSVHPRHYVIGFDKKNGNDVAAMTPLNDDIPKLDVLINCAGANRLDWLEDVKEEDWDAVIDTNVKGIFAMSQRLLPQLKASRGTILNIVSNAAHRPMRCSLAYNASKGAALIMTKQLARELTPKYGITVFSVSPNKLSGTGMSDHIEAEVMRTRGWTAAEAQAYQLAATLTGEETPVSAVAEFIAFLLQDKEHHRHLSGVDLPYGL